MRNIELKPVQMVVGFPPNDLSLSDALLFTQERFSQMISKEIEQQITYAIATMNEYKPLKLSFHVTIKEVKENVLDPKNLGHLATC